MSICLSPATEQAAALRRKEISARELLAAHLDRIERINPQVNAIVTLVPEQAERAAKAADERLARGEPVGPLHGLVVAHKDTHDTAGIRTTYGSPTLADHVPDTDDLVVERLRAAGAITVGKTNVPEFGAGSHTFNPVFGTTRNPHDLARSAGGSSGGAAAALACGLQSLADGSDMGGSLRNPASFCGVVGLRPSPGRVPTWPSDAAWSTLAVQGPMGRTVGDVALALSAMAGPDDRSPIALTDPGSMFAESLETDLSGLRVACSVDLGGAVPVAPEVAEVVRAAAYRFMQMGVHPAWDSPDFTGADEVFRTLRALQFAQGLGDLVDSVKPSLAENIRIGQRLTGPEIGRAETLRARLYHRMREFFTRYDVLVLPTSQVAPFAAELEYPTEIDGVAQRDYLDWMRSCYLVSVPGNPALSVPIGVTPGGLPVGVQIVGRHHADLQVLQVGHAIERMVARPVPAIAE